MVATIDIFDKCRPEFWTLQCQAVRCVLDSMTTIGEDASCV